MPSGLKIAACCAATLGVAAAQQPTRGAGATSVYFVENSNNVPGKSYLWQYNVTSQTAQKLAVINSLGTQDVLTGAAICGSTCVGGDETLPLRLSPVRACIQSSWNCCSLLRAPVVAFLELSQYACTHRTFLRTVFENGTNGAARARLQVLRRVGHVPLELWHRLRGLDRGRQLHEHVAGDGRAGARPRLPPDRRFEAARHLQHARSGGGRGGGREYGELLIVRSFLHQYHYCKLMFLRAPCGSFFIQIV